MPDNSPKQEGDNAGDVPARNDKGGAPESGALSNAVKKRKRQMGANELTALKVLQQAQELKAQLDSRKLSSESVALTRITPRRQPLRLTENLARRDMFAAFLAAGKPLDPIVVRPVGDGSDKLEVVDGEDRRDGAQRGQQLMISVIIVACSAEVGFALAGLLNTGHGTPLNEAEKLAFAIMLFQGNRELRGASDRALERAYNNQISDSTFLRARQEIRKRKKKPAKKPATTADKPLPAPEPPKPDKPKSTPSLKVIAAKIVKAPDEKVAPSSLDTSEEEMKQLARALYRATAELATRLKMPPRDVYPHVCQFLGEEI